MGGPPDPSPSTQKPFKEYKRGGDRATPGMGSSHGAELKIETESLVLVYSHFSLFYLLRVSS